MYLIKGHKIQNKMHNIQDKYSKYSIKCMITRRRIGQTSRLNRRKLYYLVKLFLIKFYGNRLTIFHCFKTIISALQLVIIARLMKTWNKNFNVKMNFTFFHFVGTQTSFGMIHLYWSLWSWISIIIESLKGVLNTKVCLIKIKILEESSNFLNYFSSFSEP